jgi:hypothetical protein
VSVRQPQKRPKQRRPVDEWRAHALRVADGLRDQRGERQLKLVGEWLVQALAIKKAVQHSERAVKSRLRVSASRGKTKDPTAELLAEATKSEAVREWLVSDVGRSCVERQSAAWVAREALWRAAYAAVLPDGGEKWPRANAQHLVVSAGMHDVIAKSKSFGALHVGILALVALGHSHTAIARALSSETAQVRTTLRLAGAISLEKLYAEQTAPYAE